MQRKHWRLFVLSASLLTLGGCASSEEWDVWKANSSHFAPGEHCSFSLQHREAKAATVTREDMGLARQQNWFGPPVAVIPDQILGERYQGTLKSLNAKVYHCMPWIDVKTEGIGFYKPKHLDGDTRYLSLNVVVDQHPSPEFSRLAVQDRVSSMFSRYVPHLLRSMATDDLINEPTVDGFTVIVSWLKIEPPAGQPPVFETAATFVAKALAVDYLRGRANIGQLAGGAHVLAWDGDTKLGAMKPKAWPDD